MADVSDSVENNQEKDFDQFFTKDSVAEECLSDLIEVLSSDSGYDLKDV